jgi:DNA-binding phage protein
VTTDLVPVPDYSTEIERAADPGEYVVQTLERAKVWLAQALEHGDIEQIVELKSQAEAIRVYTMSKQLGHDAQLSAAEIVRRAERGIGLAIRKGQAQGRVRVQADGPQVRDLIPEGNKVSPREFLTGGKTTTETYAMTDDVSEERFEEAIAEARAERNLSRANVIRKVRHEEKPVTVPARVNIATLPAQRRAFGAACTTLSGIAYGLSQVEEIHPDVTSEEAAEWVDGLSDARRELERVIKLLKRELTNRA